MKSKIKTISLFSGCGGLDIGFEASGFEVRFMADILKEAAETLRLNHKSAFIYGPPEFSGDITELSSEFIFNNTKLKEGEVDMIIGGPPCQPFSVAAAQRFLKSDSRFKRKGFDCEEKGNLIFEYLRLIKDLKPKAFLIENVPGLIKIDQGKTVSDLKKIFEDLGYLVKIAILEAADFGVPQNRKRAIIVGNSLGVDFKFPTKEFKLLSPNVRNFTTTAQALVGVTEDLPNHQTRDHTEDSISRYRKLNVGKREPQGRVDRLDPNLPSKTIIAGGSKGGGRSHLHPFLVRTLSVRESARLQTFPDDYIFCGSIARQFTQVGNAVPPLLAEVISRSIGEQIFNLKYPKNLLLKKDYMPANEAFELMLENAANDNKYDVYDDVLVFQ